MTVLFSDNCDDLTVPGMTETDGVSLVTSGQHEGAGCIRITSSSATQTDQGFKGRIHEVDLGVNYFHRFWMRMDPNLAWSNQNKFKASRWVRQDEGAPAFSPVTGYLGEVGVWPGEHNQGFTSDQGAGAGGEGPEIDYDFNPSTNTAVQSWHQYIIGYGIHSANDATDGFFRFYVDGSLIGQLTGVRWWSGSAPSVLEEAFGVFMLFNFPQNVNGWVDIDDVMIATTLAEVLQGGGAGQTGPRGSSLGGLG